MYSNIGWDWSLLRLVCFMLVKLNCESVLLDDDASLKD